MSLLFTIAASSADYLISAPRIWLPRLVSLAVALVLTRLALRCSFRSYSQLVIRLVDSHTERKRASTTETYSLADVVGLRVVRTSRKGIREVTARFADGRRLSMNGVEEFERLEQELRSRLPANVTSTEVREPIDYDHPLFYVVFGLITGVAFTLAVRAMATLSQSGMKWATLAIACYSAILGAGVLLTRPLSQRYGAKSRFGDLALGLFALLAGILVAVRSFLS